MNRSVSVKFLETAEESVWRRLRAQVLLQGMSHRFYRKARQHLKQNSEEMRTTRKVTDSS